MLSAQVIRLWKRNVVLAAAAEVGVEVEAEADVDDDQDKGAIRRDRFGVAFRLLACGLHRFVQAAVPRGAVPLSFLAVLGDGG